MSRTIVCLFVGLSFAAVLVLLLLFLSFFSLAFLLLFVTLVLFFLHFHVSLIACVCVKRQVTYLLVCFGLVVFSPFSFFFFFVSLPASFLSFFSFFLLSRKNSDQCVFAGLHR